MTTPTISGTLADAEPGTRCAALACGVSNREDARFCKGCGKPLPSAQTDSFAHIVGLEGIVTHLRGLAEHAGALKAQGHEGIRLHSVLRGPSGAGKTTLANAFTAALYAAGVVDNPEPVVVHASEFAAMNLADLFMKSLQRVIVFDEAHLLTGGQVENAVGNLDVLLGHLSAPRHETAPIVLLSGMPSPLREYLDQHRELQNRLPHSWDLPNLTPDGMVTLAERQFRRRFGLHVPDETRVRLLARFKWIVSASSYRYANGHAVQIEVERVALAQSSRTAQRKDIAGVPSAEVLPADIHEDVYVEKTLNEIFAELETLVGMEHVRSFIEGLLASASEQRQPDAPTTAVLGTHLIVTGNQGTGKTTVARLLGRIFEATGILPTARVLEVKRSNLVADVVGGTARLVNRACDDAMGGILFVDEAHQLVLNKGDSFGLEALKSLVPRLENDRGRFVCILAGYPTPIEELLRHDPGLPGRFPTTSRVHLPDYTADQMEEIFLRMVIEWHRTIDDSGRVQLAKRCHLLKSRAGKTFANAREMRNLFQLEVLEALDDAIRRARLKDYRGIP
jgi:type II secretory pathway predicted ATPase ExeA